MSDTRQPASPSWLASARKPYLDFLRNLPVPVFFGSFGGVLVVRMTEGAMGFGSVPSGFFALVFFCAALLAFLANASLLHEELFQHFYLWRDEKILELKRQGLISLDLTRKLLVATWHERPMRRSVVLMVVLWLVLLASLVAVVVGTTAATHTLLKGLTTFGVEGQLQ